MNRRTWDFKAMFDALPAEVQALGHKAFEQFEKNPMHTALRVHRLKDNSKGSHKPDSISVSINRQYRAIYVEVGDVNLWYWVGTHAEYDRFTGA